LSKTARLYERSFATGFCLADNELRRLVIINPIVSPPREEVYFGINAIKS
jgi:hypothetical protein